MSIMHSFVIVLLILVLTLNRYNLCFGIGNPGYVTEKGREFIIAFVENRVLVDYPIIKLYATSVSEIPVNVTFSVPLLTTEFEDETLELKPGEVAVKQYPYQLHMLMEGYQEKGLLVTSTDDITLQAASINDLTSDAFLAYPTHALGKEYYVMSHHFNKEDDPKPLEKNTHSQGPSVFGLVGFWPGTEVVIAIPGEEPFKIVLFQFQTYQTARKFDLTGTKISSRKPLAVFCGSVWTSITKTYMGDHLLEHLLPVNTWGSEFITVPIATRTGGDVFRVLAHNNATRVRIMRTVRERLSWRTYYLDEGDFQEFYGTSYDPIHIVSNKAVEVAQFCKSYEVDNVRNSDPFMTILPPTDQFSGNYTFTTPVTFNPAKQDYDHYLAIVIEDTAFDGILLNGQLITDDILVATWRHVIFTNFSAMTLNITSGTHFLSHTDPFQTFGAYIYGLKFQEAYGHALGQRVDTIDYACTKTFVVIRDRFDNDCDGRFDEEIANMIDDDGDGLIDEDLDGEIPSTIFWSSESPTTDIPSTITTIQSVTTVLPTTTIQSEYTTLSISGNGDSSVNTDESIYDTHTYINSSDNNGNNGRNNSIDDISNATNTDTGDNALDNSHHLNTSPGTNDADKDELDNFNNTVTNFTNTTGTKDDETQNNSSNNDGDQKNNHLSVSTESSTGNHGKNPNDNNQDGDLVMTTLIYISTEDRDSITEKGRNNADMLSTTLNKINGIDENSITPTSDSLNDFKDLYAASTQYNGGIDDTITSTSSEMIKFTNNYIDSNSYTETIQIDFTTRDAIGNNAGNNDLSNGLISTFNPRNDDQNSLNNEFESSTSNGDSRSDDQNRDSGNDTTSNDAGQEVNGEDNQNSGNNGTNAGDRLIHINDSSAGNNGSNSQNNGLNNDNNNNGTNDGSNDQNGGNNTQNDGSNGSNGEDGGQDGSNDEDGGQNIDGEDRGNNEQNNGNNGLNDQDGHNNESNNQNNENNGSNQGNGSNGDNNDSNGNGQKGGNNGSNDNSDGNDENNRNNGTDTNTGNKSGDDGQNGSNGNDNGDGKNGSTGDGNGTGQGDKDINGQTPSGPVNNDGSTSNNNSKKDSWWIYLVIGLCILLLLIILVFCICKKKKRKPQLHVIERESIEAPLMVPSRPHSATRSITPPTSMSSIPNLPEHPNLSPQHIVPAVLLPSTSKRPSSLGEYFDPPQENYNPSEGIWSSVSNSNKNRRKSTCFERPSSCPPPVDLPDLIISVPHSHHIKLKQLFPPNKIYSESTT